MLDSARQLFEQVGYEDATIRAIAHQAGVSVGSVFSSFDSKAHVLSEVVQERLDDLYADLAKAAPHLRGSTADRCRSLFAVHYAFEFRRLRLFLAHIGANFSWNEGDDSPPFGANPHLRGMVHECLEGGVERGDVRPDVDLELAVDMMIGAYAWNYRLAARIKADADQLSSLFDRQVGMIFDGLRPSRG